MKAGMGSMLIVEAHPGWQSGAAFVGSGVGKCIGPFALQRLNEALRLAIGLRTVRSRAFGGDVHPATRLSRGAGAIGAAVVGEYPLNLNASAPEFAHRTQPEARRGVALLVGQDFDIAKPRTVVDGNVSIFPAVAGARRMAPAGNPMPGSRETAEFLDIEVDQLARALPFVALNRLRRRKLAQAAQTDSPQHCAHRRACHRQLSG